MVPDTSMIVPIKDAKQTGPFYRSRAAGRRAEDQRSIRKQAMPMVQLETQTRSIFTEAKNEQW